VRLDHYPAFAVQRDDRLAYRNAADAQQRGDLILGDALADREAALEDLPPDVVSYLLRAGGAEQSVRRVEVFVRRWQACGAGSDDGLLVLMSRSRRKRMAILSETKYTDARR
jgi:hypothetical protein